MKKYDESRLKKYETKILEKFVDICNKNGLKYYLAYGTLLGSVRHKGFIPWDDDIDVFMPPKDYLKLQSIMMKNKDDSLFYQCVLTDKYYFLYFNKIRLNNTLAKEKKSFNEKIHQGIYIDIFPLIPYPNEIKERRKLNIKYKILCLLLESNLKNDFKYKNYGLSGKIASNILKIVPRFIKNKLSINILNSFLNFKGKYDNFIDFQENKFFSKSYFEKSDLGQFEGQQYSIPYNYDGFLKKIYGNYMELPPKEERKCHNFEQVDFDTSKIDAVILWVDGNDLNWQKEKNKYKEKNNNSDNNQSRYRDWDNLKYIFRGFEKYAPWINNIYLITCGQCPKWLNLNNPKLKLVKHSDYIPPEYLPTFNSNVIELNIPRIEELSEKFILFNDDIFLINTTIKDDFFKNNLPCDNYNEVNMDFSKENEIFSAIVKNNYNIINKYFNKRKTIMKKFNMFFNYKYGLKRNLQSFKMFISDKKFRGINNNHIAQPFLKSSFIQLWNLEPAILNNISKNKFRKKNDINQWLIRYFQLLEGKFVTRDFKLGKFFTVSNDNSKIIDTIINQKAKIICINDSDKDFNFEQSKKEINEALNKILPNKSSFEK